MYTVMNDFDKKMFFVFILAGTIVGVLFQWNTSFTAGLITYGLITAFIFVSERTLSFIAVEIAIISITFGRIAIISISGRTPDLLYVDIFAVIATYIWFGGQTLKGERLKFDILVPSVVYALVSIGTTLAHSNDLLRELSLLKTLGMGLALYLVVYNSVETLQDSRRLLRILALLGLMISATTVLNISAAGQNWWGLVAFDKNIVRINFGKNNYVAAFLALLIPIAASQIRKHGSFFQNIFFVVSFILMFVVLILTRSRGAILSLAVGLLVGGGLVFPKKTYFKVLGLTILIALAGLILLPKNFLFALVDRFAHLMDSGNLERLHMWHIAWDGFLRHPIFGSGVGSTGYLIRESLNILSLTSPHSYFFEFLAEVGIVGTVSVLYIFVTILRNAWVVSKTSINGEIRSEYGFILLGVISTLINGLVEPLHRAPQYVVVFWVLAGIIGASKRIVVSGNQSDHGV